MATLAALAASPAAANPLDDCFDKIAVAVGGHVAHHHARRRVRHLRKARHAGPPRPHLHRAAAVRRRPRPPVHHVRYVLRPRACGSHPVALMSAVPGALPPQSPQALVAALAGPAATPPGAELVAIAPAAPPAESVAPPEVFPIGAPSGVFPPGSQFIGGTVLPPGPITGPVTPPVTPPTTPPTTPPPVVPPETPPGTPPVTPVITPPAPPPPVTPPTVTPPVVIPIVDTFPPVIPPVIPPPVIVPPPGPVLPVTPGPIPEPGVWVLLLGGFFGTGAALRSRRGRAAAARPTP